jgi:hypothetical protein
MKHGDEVKSSHTSSAHGLKHVVMGRPDKSALLGMRPCLLRRYGCKEVPNLDLDKHHFPVLLANQIHFESAMPPIPVQKLKAQLPQVIPCQVLPPTPQFKLGFLPELRLHGAKKETHVVRKLGKSTGGIERFISAA